MSGADAVQPLLRSLCFLAVRCDFKDPLPRLRGPFEILLTPRADDADIEEGLRVFGIDLE